MRPCPVCDEYKRRPVWSMGYRVPDGWPLPERIDWYTCCACGMLYGDGDFDQDSLTDYYMRFYGYGVDIPENVERLKRAAGWIAEHFDPLDTIIDFGGGDGIIEGELSRMGFARTCTAQVGDMLPEGARLIFASHVLEHIYALAGVMAEIVSALAGDGTLIIDGPDATGLLQRWGLPILDFQTKHINHFRLIDYLRLGREWGLELVHHSAYELHGAPCYQMHFARYDVARLSARHVKDSVAARLKKLRQIDFPVNVWGLGDVSWHLLSMVDLHVLNYIDNDPAYRGATYQGHPVLERPNNAAPIVIMAQGQRTALIRNIRAMGVENEIIEI